jgi:hypothetical protein
VTISAIHLVLLGALAAMSATASAFFMRFYVLSGDRFFIYFAAAFGLFALNSLCLTGVSPAAEPQHYVLILRLFGFLLIIAGVIDKNRSRAGGGSKSDAESRD